MSLKQNDVYNENKAEFIAGLSTGDMFIIMCDIQKRAKEIAKELEAKGGLVTGSSIDGYKMSKKNWRLAKEIGFEKQADGQWIGFVSSGDGAYSDRGYEQALKEYKEKLPNSFLDGVSHYEYLT